MTKHQPKSFSLEHINAWRMHRQWLDRPFKGRSLVDLIQSVGWIHSPGCSTPYLSLWARMSSFRPATLNRLVFKEQKLIQLETLRGTTMLLPREHAAIALRVRSRTFSELTEQAEGMLPITSRELIQLKDSVLGALESATKNDDEILKSVPSKLVREFPSTLRRIGMTGSLRLAINLLKEEGRIVKIQSDRQLDSTEHAYALLSNFLPEGDAFELKPELANAELAALYFGAEGPARIKDFAWWSGLHVTHAMRAAEAARPKLKQIRIAGSKDEFLISESVETEFNLFKPPAIPAVNFIPFRDVYLKGQREVVSRFMKPEHFDKPFSRLRGRVSNDPMATIIQGGEVIGIWEWNSSSKGKLDFVLFDEDIPKSAQGLIKKRATELGTFIKDNLRDIGSQSTEHGRHSMTRIHDLQSTWDQTSLANAGRA
jgi:hypothetical protein